jgi:UDP-N-acetylmuramate dehydrogenase
MIKIQEKISLQEYTTFQIGGEADYIIVVKNIKDLEEALNFAAEKNLPFFILAGGSNILFSDNGFSGVIIKMDFTDIEIKTKNFKITAGAGVILLDLIKLAVENNLAGMENMTGIPGTVGGAVRGNAEAFQVQAGDLLEKVEVFNLKTKQIEIYSKDECQFAYRQSLFKQNENLIILRATFQFEKGRQVELETIMQEIQTKRNKLQLQDVKSAGSFFTNPVADTKVQKLFEKATGAQCRNNRVPAGWLLDQVGLLGKRIGGVGTGEKHANYFVNYGGGTCDQVLQLASLAKSRVRDKFGVQLVEEVKLVC